MSECCRQLAKDEVEHGFPLLRLNYSTEADRIVATFQTLPLGERLETALSLATLQPERTVQQEKLVEAFRARKMGHSLPELEGMAIQPLGLHGEETGSHVVGTEVEMALSRHAALPLKKTDLRRCFLARLRSDYEQNMISEGVMEYKCLARIGDWRVLTIFDFGGVFQFRVGYMLEHPQLPIGPHLGGATLGSMLGFAELGWDSVTSENLAAAAGDAAKLCSEMRARFVQVTSRVSA